MFLLVREKKDDFKFGRLAADMVHLCSPFSIHSSPPQQHPPSPLISLKSSVKALAGLLPLPFVLSFSLIAPLLLAVSPLIYKYFSPILQSSFHPSLSLVTISRNLFNSCLNEK